MTQTQHNRRIGQDAEPGSGVQYYVEATTNPRDHPRLSEEIDGPEDNLDATQFRAFGRVWQCGGEYWDIEQKDIVELDAVVRKSSWCHSGDVENAPLFFQFRSDQGTEIEYNPQRGKESMGRTNPTERFLPRYNVPFKLP